jgi:hypothetical protein
VRGKKLETSMMMDEINSYYGEKGGTGKRWLCNMRDANLICPIGDAYLTWRCLFTMGTKRSFSTPSLTQLNVIPFIWWYFFYFHQLHSFQSSIIISLFHHFVTSVSEIIFNFSVFWFSEWIPFHYIFYKCIHIRLKHHFTSVPTFGHPSLNNLFYWNK